MYCPVCGSQQPDNTKFCAHCGTVLHAPDDLPSEEELLLNTRVKKTETASAYCPRCGMPLIKGQPFCTSCGFQKNAMPNSPVHYDMNAVGFDKRPMPAYPPPSFGTEGFDKRPAAKKAGAFPVVILLVLILVAAAVVFFLFLR